MRHGTSARRQRGRGNGGNNGNSGNNGGRRGNGTRMKVYDSNGPDVRIRGTAHQVAEKYLTLAKDAASSDDRSLSESYLQHAEHYQRIINTLNEDVQAARPQGNSAEKPRRESQPERQKQDDDLSLPSSILGESPKVEKEAGNKTRTGELSEA